MPTLLTEKHHCPTHPFLDFSFFHFVENTELKLAYFIGIFIGNLNFMAPL